jgi:hypothetical protein
MTSAKDSADIRELTPEGDGRRRGRHHLSGWLKQPTQKPNHSPLGNKAGSARKQVARDHPGNFMPSRLETDLDLFRQAGAASIWRHGDGSRANEDALRALRKAIVEECRDVLNQQRDKLRKELNHPLSDGGAIQALEYALAEMQKLKE